MPKTSSERLGNLIELKRGYDLPEKARQDGPYPVVSSSGISGYHSNYKASAPGVVTGRYGTLGKVYYLECDYWPHNTALYVKDFKGNDSKYVYYLLACLGRIRSSDKSAVPGVNRNELHEMKVPLILDTDIQSKISGVLSSLDAKIELNDQINTELEAMVRMIFDYWFVQFDFPDAFGNPYKSSGGKMVFCDSLKREIPATWEAGTLSDLGEIVGGSTPSRERSNYFTDEGIPWITPNDLSNNVGNKFIEKGSCDITIAGKKAASLQLLPEGSVLMSSRAPIGYMAIARCPLTTNQGFKSFIPNKGFSEGYVYYSVHRALPAILKNAGGSTFKEISGATLKAVKTCLPSESVARDFSTTISPMLEKQGNLEAENSNLVRLRDWLLPMLMNGQVVVDD